MNKQRVIGYSMLAIGGFLLGSSNIPLWEAIAVAGLYLLGGMLLA